MSDQPSPPDPIAPTDPDAEELALLKLPAARECAPQETIQADRLLTEANVARRRENYVEAEQKCRAAIELAPADAAAIEMLGDILQGVARVDEALLAYRRAARLDSRRAGAERKYAELLVRQEAVPDTAVETLPRNAWVAVLLSLLLPGAGQVYNGERIKGGVLIFAMVLCGLAWLAFVPSGQHIRQVGSPTIGIVTVGGLIYMYALIDANRGARREVSREGRTGWEV